MSNLIDLQAQIAELQAKADAIRNEERGGAIAQVKEVIAAFGLTATEVGLGVVVKQPKITKKAEAKYKDDNGNTWSGRGLQPKWLKKAIENGQTLESFKI